MAKRRRRQRYSGPDLTSQLGLNLGDRFMIRAEGFDDKGAASAVMDGAPISISGAIPGEDVEVEVLKVFPERVATVVREIHEASGDRIEPRCRYFDVCSGCQWQHIAYQKQLELKRDAVVRAVGSYESLRDVEILPALPSPKQFGYRNHARFTVGRGDYDGVAGYVNADTRRFVQIDECAIMHDGINETLAKLQGRLRRMTQFSVRIGANTGDMIIQPLLPAEIQDIESGRQRYEEEVDGVRFQVAASSFFQVNTDQLSNVVQEIVEMLETKGDETLIDLYCGVGTFSALLSPYVSRVVGVEESASAIADAKRNSSGLSHVSFIEARAESVTEELVAMGVEPDIVLIDPPRVGCAPSTLAAIELMAPERVVMVSCDLGTMARDLDVLCRGRFRLMKVRPVDMFPQTRHIETVSLLEMCSR